jgi:hypothetical protein
LGAWGFGGSGLGVGSRELGVGGWALGGLGCMLALFGEEAWSVDRLRILSHCESKIAGAPCDCRAAHCRFHCVVCVCVLCVCVCVPVRACVDTASKAAKAKTQAGAAAAAKKPAAPAAKGLFGVCCSALTRTSLPALSVCVGPLFLETQRGASREAFACLDLLFLC